jgi:hypothetical protein
MATSIGTHDISQVDCYEIKMRGQRPYILLISPNGAEVLDSANVKIKIGVSGGLTHTLTVGSGIVDNTDGTFTATITPDMFRYHPQAEMEIYGYENLPNIEAAIAKIKYTKGIE